ncbi:uncharacterized protein METZ01_LOCUS184633, partial [marine metagenome]
VKSFSGVSDVKAADMDGDSDIDIVASAASGGDKLSVFFNDGSPNDADWTEVVIESDCDKCQEIDIIDMDGDGDKDVLVVSQDDNSVFWYRNDGTPADGGFNK